jgi:hypothetical protein
MFKNLKVEPLKTKKPAMTSTSQTTGDSQQCPVCRRSRPKQEFRRMWRFPLFVLRIAHMHPGTEGDWWYCRRCVSSQNISALFLAILAVFAFSIGGKAMQVGWIVGAIVGVLVWTVAYLRWRFQSQKTK